ncbi:hypothetical protein J7E91_31650 [Streptomyces sp. ISL-99]|uniref:hypothetical protein n=1 Tax=Streptomyces sp. ISL-99 TaxID=2819193 RepID=UPI001BE80E58|nr:hypothetical protein [Streptomyces sp. ISL-99]MBT2529808.1 hypothetical protein [Streptomyces sp. ISL-99]
MTNITALGAVLGTVVTTTGFLQDWLPGISLGPFLGLNLLFGGTIVFAPIVYAASCMWGPETNRPDKKAHPVGRGWGLMAAAGTTLFGVFGQLATTGALIDSSTASRTSKGLLLVLLVISALTVTLYAIRFVRGAISGTAESGTL